MPIRIRVLLTAVLLSAAIFAPTARAESWPALEKYVPQCPLIVHVRIVPYQVEPDQDYTLCTVEESICGEYRPLDFEHRPPTGFVFLPGPYVPPPEGKGRDLIAFYSPNSVNQEGLLRQPDMTLKVDDGKVTYPPQGEPAEQQTMDLAAFKRHLRAIASDVPAGATAARPVARPREPRWDLEGEWRMFLPAGFERAVSLKCIGGNRYRLEPGELVFSGVYELQKDFNFVLVESSHARPGDFSWQMHSQYLLSLVEQKLNNGANYAGTTMFRPKPAAPAAAGDKASKSNEQAPERE